MVNLDPANDNIPYDCVINVADLLSHAEAMERFGLGPNGALLHCMDNLEANFAWLRRRLEACDAESYFVFDLPGQVELFTNHEAVYRLLRRLERELQFRLVAVHLADASHCRDPLRYMSLATLTLQAMLRLECPQINVLSKFDLFDLDVSSDAPWLPLSYYAECRNLHVLTESGQMRSRFGARLARLNAAVADLIEDFGLVSFVPVAVEDKECMAFVLQETDKANGFVFGGLTRGNESILQTAMTTTSWEEYLESMERKYVRSEADKNNETDCE